MDDKWSLVFNIPHLIKFEPSGKIYHPSPQHQSHEVDSVRPYSTYWKRQFLKHALNSLQGASLNHNVKLWPRFQIEHLDCHSQIQIQTKHSMSMLLRDRMKSKTSYWNF